MQKKGLKKSTKSKSTHLLLKQDERITKIEQQFVKRLVAAPRKSVRQMVQAYDENIIPPPPEFRDGYKPTPKPRTIKIICQSLHQEIK